MAETEIPKIVPTLLNAVHPDLPMGNYVNYAGEDEVTLNHLAQKEGGWHASVVEAHRIGQNRTQIDKASRQLAGAMVERGKEPEQPQRKLQQEVYLKTEQQAKKNDIRVSPEYASAMYLEILPELIRINGLSANLSSEREFNGVDQVVSAAQVFMRAESIAEAGGRVQILSPMCAQYASSAGHEASSFTKGLLEAVDPDKLDHVTESFRKIGSTLQRFGIELEVINPQVTDDPDLLLALVPATVWGYVEHGEVHTLLEQLETHRRQIASQSEQADTYRHRALSLAEVAVNTERGNIVSETMYLAGLFEQMNDLPNKIRAKILHQAEPSTKKWEDFDIGTAKALIDTLDSGNNYREYLQELQNYHGWGTYETNMFQAMVSTLCMETWGTLDDTAKFYARENQRRALSVATDWRRNIDYDTEVEKLLENTDFASELGFEERQLYATRLVHGIDRIANIGIGGRAIFNVALYAALGYKMVEMNSDGNVGMMMPVEEDRDRWAVDVMNKVWRQFKGDTSTAPVVYPEKSRRQPLTPRISTPNYQVN